jgi:hypothetical protein
MKIAMTYFITPTRPLLTIINHHEPSRTMEIPFKSHGIRGKETRSWSPVSQCWALRAPATRSGGDAEGWSKLDHPLGLLGILGRSKLELVFVVGKS